MRIAAWNIQNGGGKRSDGIARALFEVNSDVCVLSEFIKASSQRLTSALNDVGYNHVLHTEPEGQWGGIVVASRLPIELREISDCPSPERWLHFAIPAKHLEIGAAYIPNAERSRTEKAEYWKWLLDAGAKLVGRSAIICGDFNTGMPYVDEKDKTLKCSKLMGQMLQSKWTDLWRTSHFDQRESSWWSTRGNGFRLDHAFGSPSAVTRCSGAEYVTNVNDLCVTHPYRSHVGCERQALSDHSMLVVEID
jgi:exonuclease III